MLTFIVFTLSIVTAPAKIAAALAAGAALCWIIAAGARADENARRPSADE